MNHKEYNGWYNYETWCFNVWHGHDWNNVIKDIVDNYHYNEGDVLSLEERHVIELSDYLKDWQESVYEGGGHSESITGFLSDILSAGLSEINWHELAKNYYQSYLEDHKDVLG